MRIYSILLFLLLVPLTMAAPERVFGTREAPLSYVLDCTELHCRPNVGKAHSLAIQASEENLAAVAKIASEKALATGFSFDLVFYPKNKAKNVDNRRVMTPKIAVISTIPLADYAAKHGLTLAPHRSAPDWQILTCADSVSALTHYDSLVKKHGRDRVLPLLSRQFSKRLVPTDPRFSYSNNNTSYQWHLRNTGQNNGVSGIDANITTAWDSYRGAGITIGIVDDGLENSHPDLSPNVNTSIDYNWNSGPTNDASPTDPNDSHGTSCAGVAAARDGNSIGGVGAAPRATLVGLRLIAGDVSDAEEAEALGWESNTIHIYSNSWGPSDFTTVLNPPGPLLENAITSSLTNGRNGKGNIYTWAGGNGHLFTDNSNYDGYANLIGTIAVGSINDKGTRSEYSERGANLIISAPSDGGNSDQSITTTSTEAAYTDFFGGTSSATPLVSGVCALILEANPNLGWRDVQEILIASAEKNSPAHPEWITNGAGYHFNHEYGAGLIDASAAVALAGTWTNLGTHESRNLSTGAINIDIPSGSTGVTQTFDFSNLDGLRVEHAVLKLSLTNSNLGSLDIRLTSPDGTESRLMEPHSDSSSTISSWPFSTARCWGESSIGTWTLKITRTDSSSQNGKLQLAQLTLHGTANDQGIDSPPFITSPLSVSAFQGVPFFYQIAASRSPQSFTAINLPAGLSVDASGLISGTPTTISSNSVTITATNEFGTDTKTLNLSVTDLPGQDLAAAIEFAGYPIETEGSSAWNIFPISTAVAGTSYIETGTTNDGESNAITTSFVLETPSTLSFYWRISSEAGYDEFRFEHNGTHIGSMSGTRNWEKFSINLDVGAHSFRWAYVRDIDTGGGINRAFLDAFSLTPAEDTFANYRAATESHLNLNSSGAHWKTTTSSSFDGEDSLQTTRIGNNQSATLSAQVTGPGTLDFYWRVESETNLDIFSASMDGTVFASSSGVRPNFVHVIRSIPVGTHNITWTYTKDESALDGTDSGYLDRIRYVRNNSYESFANNKFGNVDFFDSTISGPNADPDGDQQSNLMEWFFDTNPKVYNIPSQPQFIDNSFTFPVNTSLSEVRYRVEASTDLTNWAPIPTTAITTSPTLPIHQATIPPENKKLFLRLHLEKAPPGSE